jgi:hypothetical protein
MQQADQHAEENDEAKRAPSFHVHQHGRTPRVTVPLRICVISTFSLVIQASVGASAAPGKDQSGVSVNARRGSVKILVICPIRVTQVTRIGPRRVEAGGCLCLARWGDKADQAIARELVCLCHTIDIHIYVLPNDRPPSIFGVEHAESLDVDY